MTSFYFNDGGRAKAGFKGSAGDCVVRAIAIATGKPYETVYSALRCLNAEYANMKSCKVAAQIRNKGASPRNGNFRAVYHQYLLSLGFQWRATMGIGTGCTTRLRADELPSGVIICRLSRHLVTVNNGVIHDTHDCSRGGTRCVYGYYYKPTTN